MNRNFLGAYLLPWQPLSTRVKYESLLNRYNGKILSIPFKIFDESLSIY